MTTATAAPSSTNALLAALAAKQAQASRQRTAKLPSGRSRWRVLPTWKTNGDPTFWHDFGQHFIKDAANQVKAVAVCMSRTFNQPCEACDLLARAISQSGDDLTKKRFEDMLAGSKVLVNALHIDGPQPNVPQLLELPPSVFTGKKGVGGLIGLMQQYPQMLDPAAGFDVIIEKSGSGMDTSYAVNPVVGPSNPVPAEALTKLHDLDAYVKGELEGGKARALQNLSAVTGLLPAPRAEMASGVIIEPAASIVANVAPAVAAAPVVAAPAAPVVVEAPMTADPFAGQPPHVKLAVDGAGGLGTPGGDATFKALTGMEPVKPVAAAVAPAPAGTVVTAAPAAAATVVTPPAGAAAAAAAATPIASTGDPELDALLQGIESPAK